MNSQDKGNPNTVKAAIIGGIFAVIAACIGGVFLIINTFINNGFVFAGAGNQNTYPTTTPNTNSTSATGIPQNIISQPTTSNLSNSSRTLLGLWEFGGNRPVMPSPATTGQVIFANGDIDNSGICHVKVFGPGDPVQGLGEGTFQLWLITGNPEQIAAHEEVIQQGAASEINNSLHTCSYLP